MRLYEIVIIRVQTSDISDWDEYAIYLCFVTVNKANNWTRLENCRSKYNYV